MNAEPKPTKSELINSYKKQLRELNRMPFNTQIGARIRLLESKLAKLVK